MSLKHEQVVPESIQATVALWQSRIEGAKRRWERDMDRMRTNMRFAMGYQWPCQRELDCDQYVCNITLRAVNQKVASLYAKNPKAVAKPRKRLNFMVWDGKRESLMLAIMRGGADVESGAIIEDYWQGTQMKQMLEKVGETLETVYQYQIDRHEPEFKRQMKSLVRRVVICGVGFVRLRFEREFESSLMSDRDDNTVTLARQAQEILERVIEGDVTPQDADVERLRVLTQALQQPPEQRLLSERLVFDFPSATSVIVDPSCVSLTGFVGADWVAQEFVMPVREVNEYFEVDLQAPTVTVRQDANIPGCKHEDSLVEVWEVFDKRTQSCFFMANGHKDYLSPPVPIYPRLHRFWPIFALTFNDVEYEDADDATIYPPSDVQLLKHVQRERNRMRDEQRNHRNANRPKYGLSKGALLDQDIKNLEGTPSSGIIELQGLALGQKISDVLQPIIHAPLDPTLYNTQELNEDTMFATGQQEANLGPAPSNVTATVGTIAEQSRLSVTDSNVNDLDALLTDLARAGGETLLLNMTVETVKRIAGGGAVWPEVEREMFANEVLMEIEAASSGRPNRAVDIANFERLAPIMMQAGVPMMYIARESIKRLDDNADIDAAMAESMIPTPNPQLQQGAAPAQQAQQGQGQPKAGASQPLQQLPSEGSIPLAGHNQ